MAVIIALRRVQRLALFAVITIIATFFFLERVDELPRRSQWPNWVSGYVPSSYDWAGRRQKNPMSQSVTFDLSDGGPRELPRIQHEFSRDELNEAHNKTQRERRDAVLNATRKSWSTYRDHALRHDQVSPQSLRPTDSFAGWGATLVDSLDTLWILGLRKEFREAVRLVAKIDWDDTKSKDCSLFETNIRYLGGLLSAYELSNEEVLLRKAIELGEMLYAAFDTPNNLPANEFNFDEARSGGLVADKQESSAAVGTLSLEFIRLSQLAGDLKFYAAVDNIKHHLERTQDGTMLPGMWPMYIDLKNNFRATGNVFSLGALADSAYEYLSKTYALLGARDQTYKTLHRKAAGTIKKHLLFRPMLPDMYPAKPPDVLFTGMVRSNGKIIELTPEVQHLACFTGGMFALGGKLFHDDEDVKIGERLARGCAWAYDVFPTGIMPERSYLVPCPSTDSASSCEWNETLWTEAMKKQGTSTKLSKVLPKPFSSIHDRGYYLRPEAIESIFILYRITGKQDLLDVAWRMFQAIRKATETKFAFSAVSDVMAEGSTNMLDAMEVSQPHFWQSVYLPFEYFALWARKC